MPSLKVKVNTNSYEECNLKADVADTSDEIQVLQ